MPHPGSPGHVASNKMAAAKKAAASDGAPEMSTDLFSVAADAVDRATAAFTFASAWAKEPENITFVEIAIAGGNWPDGSLHLQGALNKVLTPQVKAGMIRDALKLLREDAEQARALLAEQLAGSKLPAAEGVEVPKQ